MEIVPRPGISAEVDSPVTTTGEIDRTVFLRRGEVSREVSSFQVQLVDPLREHQVSEVSFEPALAEES